jgi:hypothetical protein
MPDQHIRTQPGRQAISVAHERMVDAVPMIRPPRSVTTANERAAKLASVFTDYLPTPATCSPHSYRQCRHAYRMADFLVALGIIGFALVLLGLIWALDRV